MTRPVRMGQNGILTKEVPGVQLLNVSDHSVQVHLGDAITLEYHQRVATLTRLLLERCYSGILNIQPAYATVLVSFDPRRTTHAEARQWIGESVKDMDTPFPTTEVRLIEIPVCYGGEFGPDLDFVARWNELTGDEVVRLHSSAEYRVFFLGFSPGFPYLGGMPAEIATPRLDTPRKTVPAGSVAIGGNQTGIYPAASAAGWRVIGRTPLRLFRPDHDPPTLLRMGDRVRFAPVSREKYERAQSDSR
jgi:inhibitor of KinA